MTGDAPGQRGRAPAVWPARPTALARRATRRPNALQVLVCRAAEYAIGGGEDGGRQLAAEPAVERRAVQIGASRRRALGPSRRRALGPPVTTLHQVAPAPGGGRCGCGRLRRGLGLLAGGGRQRVVRLDLALLDGGVEGGQEGRRQVGSLVDLAVVVQELLERHLGTHCRIVLRPRARNTRRGHLPHCAECDGCVKRDAHRAIICGAPGARRVVRCGVAARLVRVEHHRREGHHVRRLLGRKRAGRIAVVGVRKRLHHAVDLLRLARHHERGEREPQRAVERQPAEAEARHEAAQRRAAQRVGARQKVAGRARGQPGQ
eukprot:3136089-Prymnesium_polylepis.2